MRATSCVCLGLGPKAMTWLSKLGGLICTSGLISPSYDNVIGSIECELVLRSFKSS